MPEASSSNNKEESISQQAETVIMPVKRIDGLKEIEAAIRKGESWDKVITASAKFVASKPQSQPQIVGMLAEGFNVSPNEVSKQLDLQGEQRVEGYRFEEALNFLASGVPADFSIDEILPGHLAHVIDESCKASNTDWKSAVFLLLAAASGLTGNRVVCVSPRSHNPISLTLMVLNCGDSSANKDITTTKIMGPMTGQAKLAKLVREAELAEAKKIQDSDQRKAEELRIRKSRADVLCQGLSFSAESLVFEVSNRTANGGFHIHQREGSDFLACERWGSGQSQNSSGPGLLRKTLMEAWDGPLDGEYIRQNSDKCASFNGQSMSLTLNCQMRFVPEIVDFDEDGLGWTSRLLVVLAQELDATISPKKRQGVDPLSQYVTERLIPFTQAIELRKSKQVSTTGFAMDFVQLELDQWDGAEARYESFCSETKEEIRQSEEQGVEPAYLSFLKKTPVRIMKFASLLHIFQVIEGKQIPKADKVFDYQTYKPSCDVNAELVKNGGISIETFERAIKLELIARNQYQVVADRCRTAPAKRTERIEVGENLTLAGVLLDKLKRYGEINERQFKDKVKNKKTTRPQVTACIDELVKQGNISRIPVEGKPGYLLSFVKDIRT